MRPSQKSNRSRGRGHRKPNGNNINRVYESAGPEGKVRGTPQQIYDKYLSLARDAQTSGDRVVAENFLQHAEHYQRIIVEAQGAREDRRDAQPDIDSLDGDQRDELDSDDDEMVRPSFVAPRQHERPRTETPPRPVGEVAGLTTIDAGGDNGGSLLVETEDVSMSQPPRRRRRGPGPEDAMDVASAESEGPSE